MKGRNNSVSSLSLVSTHPWRRTSITLNTTSDSPSARRELLLLTIRGCHAEAHRTTRDCLPGGSESYFRGTIPWISPELFDPESSGLKESRPTKELDSSALGMVVGVVCPA